VVSPATAPMLINTVTNFSPFAAKALAKGAYGTIPVMTKHTAIYNKIHARRLPRIPMGKSL